MKLLFFFIRIFINIIIFIYLNYLIMWKKILKFLKKFIWIDIKFDIYIYINNDWHLIGEKQLRDMVIESRDNEEKAKTIVGLHPRNEVFRNEHVKAYTLAEIEKLDILNKV